MSSSDRELKVDSCLKLVKMKNVTSGYVSMFFNHGHNRHQFAFANGLKLMGMVIIRANYASTVEHFVVETATQEFVLVPPGVDFKSLMKLDRRKKVSKDYLDVRVLHLGAAQKVLLGPGLIGMLSFVTCDIKYETSPQSLKPYTFGIATAKLHVT